MSFDEQAETIITTASAAMNRVREEMRIRSKYVHSVTHAKEILAETEYRLTAIIKVASDKIDRLALDEKRKEWS
ncbi:hypothetical protein FJY93_00020 [Candidatus Kaiserbacteria bacterium]|nr:hypothetical protein [Candidatus Kaiserbacteria bacterium]